MVFDLLDRLQAKLEILRLEKRYARRRNRRSTFVSNAVYVDGEYIYNTPNTTGSSTASSPANDYKNKTAATLPCSVSTSAEPPTKKQKSRWSSMPGLGSNSAPSPSTHKPSLSHRWPANSSRES